MNMKRNQRQWVEALTKISRGMVVADLLMWAFVGFVVTAIAGPFLLGSAGFLMAPLGAIALALIRLYVMRRDRSLDSGHLSQADRQTTQSPKPSQREQRLARGWHLGWDILLTSLLFTALIGGFWAQGFGWPVWAGVTAGAGVGWLLGIFALWREGRFSFQAFSPNAKPPQPTTQAVTIAVLDDETEIGQQILIEKPLAEVFRYVNDFVRHSEWRTGIVEMRCLSLDGRNRVGNRWRQKNNEIGPAAKPYSVWEITEFEPERKIAYRCSYNDDQPMLRMVAGYFAFAPAQLPTTGTMVAQVVQLRNIPDWNWSAPLYHGVLLQDLIALKMKLETGKCPRF